MKNPNFNREELILCLDLYFKLDYGQMHGRNISVIQLSTDLRSLNIHPDIPDKKSFRSVNSIALKLANFKRLDSNFEGKGMKMGGKMDREIWNEFHKHRSKLVKEATFIRQLYLQPESPDTQSVKKPDVIYKSEFLFQYHKNRETDPLVIKIKKELVLAESKKLKCEV
jgi:5-methylcytosine-specific restriction protein A